jgi:outer membrane protein TolC
VQEAAQHNPDLAAASASVDVARFQHRGSYSNFYPQLSLDSSYTRTRQTALSSDSSRRSDLALTLTQNLFSGFRDTGQVEQTLANFDATNAGRLAVKAQVSFDLKAAFARLLYAQEQLQLAETIAARRKENMEMVELRFEAGREHKGSFLRSQATYQQAAFEVEQARRALRVAQQELGRVLGRRTTDGLQVSGSFGVTLPSTPPDFATLAKRTPTHLVPEAQARAARAAVTVARASFFPELSANGSVGQERSNAPAGTDASDWSTGLTLTFPLFSGGQDYYDVQSARAGYRLAQETLRSADDQSVFELTQAFAALQDAAGQAAVRRGFLRASETRAEITRNLYTTGLLSFDDWDVIENDLITSRKQMLVSERDQLIAEAAWELAQGAGALPGEGVLQ